MTAHHSEPSGAAAHLRLFHSWTNTQLSDLLPDTDVITVAAGTVIERVGNYAQQFVGIVDGFVEALADEGAVMLGRGDHFGASELFDDVKHRATYTAITPTTLLVVFGPTFRGVGRSLRSATTPSFLSRAPSTHAEPALVG